VRSVGRAGEGPRTFLCIVIIRIFEPPRRCGCTLWRRGRSCILNGVPDVTMSRLTGAKFSSLIPLLSGARMVDRISTNDLNILVVPLYLMTCNETTAL